MESSSNRPAIEDVTWLADNNTLAFLGEHPSGLHQLYIFNVRTKRLRKLTQHPTDLIWYSMTPDGRKFAFTAEQPVSSIFDSQARRAGLTVTQQSSYPLFQGIKGGVWGQPQLFFAPLRPRRLRTEGQLAQCCSPEISLSPNGRYIVIAVQVVKVPKVWKEYSDPFVSTTSKWKVPVGGYSNLQTYLLVDTNNGRNQILLNVPLNSNGWQVAWSPDSRSVAIGGTYLPLDDARESDRGTRRSTTFAVEVNVLTLKVTIITGDKLKLLSWDARTDALIFADQTAPQNERFQTKVLYRKERGFWQRSDSVRPEDASPSIVLEQSMNSPPKIYAIQQQKQGKTLLLDLNPSFAQLQFASVEEIRWKGPDGHEHEGGLYLPVDYAQGRRYPLVIQTHGWTPDRFWIDGPFTTAFAAQPLAGLDIMVLQTSDMLSNLGTPREVIDNVEMILSAVDYLDERKLIQRDRVGIIGFSRSCLYVKYALTHSAFRFAAASVTDGVDGGYLQYLLSLSSVGGSFAQEVEGINGGLPFGQGLTAWLERSPSFGIDKVQTPLRITALSPLSALGEWEWYAALSRLSKPVDMVVMEDGSHLLERPFDRMISLQGNVDWFAFWLKGEEDTNPLKANQYLRWKKLAAAQTTTAATATP
jgi:dipeptidyl aminopeptidase/acylaminoacyl peptidase